MRFGTIIHLNLAFAKQFSVLPPLRLAKYFFAFGENRQPEDCDWQNLLRSTVCITEVYGDSSITADITYQFNKLRLCDVSVGSSACDGLGQINFIPPERPQQ